MKIRWCCRLGWHRWFHGQFAFPVWGRWERRCLWCPEKQYKNKEGVWTTFETVGVKI